MSAIHCVALPANYGYPAHGHDVFLDPRTGNGRADPAGDGHMHEVISWHVMPSDDGHTHALSCPATTSGLDAE